MNSGKTLKAVLAVSLGAALCFGHIVPSAQAAVKSGATCKVIGKKSIVGQKTYRCSWKSGKKVWKLVSTLPAYGSASRPVELGASIRIGDFSFSVSGFKDDVSSEICERNMFNSGCTFNDDFDSIVDPDSTKRWVRFEVTARNFSNETKEPYIAEIGVLFNGSVVKSGIFGPVVDDDLGDLPIIPGGTATGGLYIHLEKSISPTVLVLIPSSFADKYYFFKAK